MGGAGVEYDAVIVGARVAGSSLGLLLAGQQRRVLLLDRDAFPSDTLSTHFTSPPVVGMFHRLGVLEDILAAGFRPITRHRTTIEDCVFEGPAAPGGHFSLAPRRNVLDATLIEHALAAGAEVSSRTVVERLIEEDGAVRGVVAVSKSGERRELRARVVVGADGKTSKLAQWVGAGTYREQPPLRPVYYGYYNGVAPLPEPTLELFFGGGRLGFLFPMRPGEDCLALELSPDEFEEFRTDPQARFEQCFAGLPGMKARLAGARLEGKLLGTKGVANYFRVPYGPGWALTGDAAYLKDPSTGSGIGDALTQAFMLAGALGSWLDGAEWEPTMAEYQRRRDEALLPFYELTLEHTRSPDMPPEGLAALRGALVSPVTMRLLASALPGHLAALLPAHELAGVTALARMFGEAAAAPVAASS